ncbi:methylmalonyl Co-A mutase-associated GTPase MeaB [Candidatus Acetothermia bacterium]|jgi:LAO/AO transport system kinase|nr:methylmalonyl Co-A mutase-associated GTPase MeaB [Candidatus Acetothermia bacterium]MCI2431794.1 methylmalonyl Co-A mutase-associated GTPase MeaB [Candidatus Acetothermia bacterium]MCI2437192.1 methylmalonyl Co-A mutase-associated GTPase MeaB [Candidatus Acetothermia bacterium]
MTQRWLQRFDEKDPIALAKLISAVENRLPGYQELLDALYARTGNAYRIGITGPPGAGKSSLVDRLVPLYRAEAKTVAVLACDPTSPFTGGALLGDRIRMQDLVTNDDGVFIRSMATRGSLGGLAKAAQEVALVLEAFGFDLILFETIGVGQVEIDIAQAADSVVVVLVPQSGDVIQAMKAGLMEIGDIFCINKADQGEADLFYKNLQTMLSLAMRDWIPPIVQTVATAHQGIEKLKEALEKHRIFLGEEGLRARRRERLRVFIKELIEDGLRVRLWDGEGLRDLESQLERVWGKIISPHQAVQELLQKRVR